jgi:hypothetical protein
VAVTLVTALLFWLCASPFFVIIGAGIAGILIFQDQTLEADSSEAGDMFHVKQAIILLSILLVALLFLYVLNPNWYQFNGRQHLNS